MHITMPEFAASVSGTLSEIANATSYQVLTPKFPIYPNAANSLSASKTTEAFVPVHGPATRVNRQTHTWVTAKNPTLSYTLVIEDDVFARDYGPTYNRMVRIETDGAVTTVRTKPNTHVHGVSYDGAYVYWLELSGGVDPLGAQSHLEVWRTAYTRDVMAFNTNAEMLASLDGSFEQGGSFVYDGVFVASTIYEAIVVRVSDKKVKRLVAAPTIQFQPFYVDQKEIWMRYEVAKPADVHFAKVALDW